jgi:acetamidase/formamidase
MAEYFLDHSITHNFWDRSYPPRLHIDSGDTVIFDVGEGSGGQVTPQTTAADLPSIDRSRLHALVGPVFVNGAEPGDALEVEMLNFQHHGWGFTYITPGSLLASEFEAPYIHHWRVEDWGCVFDEEKAIVVPFEPFCGILGVAPQEDGRLNTYPPRRNAGNIDIRGVGRGARVWLPVLAPGALFSTGDTHAAQGEGEVCGTAVECPMQITLRFHLRKNMRISDLRFTTPGPAAVSGAAGYYVTSGTGPDIYENARTAVRAMIDYLSSEHCLTRAEAYVLCSASVDLKISNIVTPPNRVVTAHLPLSIFQH